MYNVLQIKLIDSQIYATEDLREDFYNSTSDLKDKRIDLNCEATNLEFRGTSNNQDGELEYKLKK